MLSKRQALLAGIAAAGWLADLAGVAAQTSAPDSPAPLPPGYWFNGVHFSAQLDAGLYANPAEPKLNNWQLFTDRANQPALNQFMLAAERKVPAETTGFDWGFRLAAIYGTDARYTHLLGVLDQALPRDEREQVDLVEASVTLHLPYLGSGGTDVKTGIYPSPLGYETIDPAGSPFYSHSYIFNFTLPVKHAGFVATVHASSLLDLYFGVDAGANTSFGPSGATNASPRGIFGLGVNMMDGNLTIVGLSHLGPEQAERALALASPTPYDANGFMRYYNDLVITWKLDPKLTLASETSWVHDAYGFGRNDRASPANAFGTAGYVSYALTDQVTLNARAEVFRDDNGYFVAAFPGNYDYVDAQKGGVGPYVNSSYNAPAATYGALTLGLTYSPPVPAPLTAVSFRPEIRYDQSLGGVKAFGATFNQATQAVAFRDSGAFFAGMDFIVRF